MVTRVLAVAIVVVVIAYWILRILASECNGAACDAYIPFSLLLPILAILLAGVAGGIAAYEARARRPWAVAFAGLAVAAVVVPIIVAFALSDNDTKVGVSTILVLTVPAAIGLSAVWPRARID